MFHYLEIPQNAPKSVLKKGFKYPAIHIGEDSPTCGRYFAVNVGEEFPMYTTEHNVYILKGASWIVHDKND